ncbi:ABC transporter ATP-binding protein [Anaerococcus sp. Marseille-Q7828]|uniref:ABC transporter ATP-binding protein n=1 Tax=Anaerococcus sp. Marseille-Q7828 TaxID=3036300 RepID=UPI0024AD2EF2|nr:ABC transporter ATP-binding protein [Anaerococcus sp. Marseille-Q7828]
MKDYLKNRFALTAEGAKGTSIAILYSTLKNLSFMLPIFLLMYTIQGLLGLGDFSLKATLMFYIIVAIIMALVLDKDYKTTYNETYKESANLRISLAEKLKDLPLSFYASHDLTDLSQTIMKDVETIEHCLSHSIPGFYGFIISFCIVSILLLIGNVRLALAIIIPILASILLTFLSKNRQKKATGEYYKDQRESARIFQELIDSSTEIKAYNLSESKEKEAINFVNKLEKKHVATEISQVIPVTLSQIVARFALGFAIYFGLKELIEGNINILYFSGYLFAAARLIDGVDQFVTYYGEFMYIDSPVEKIKSIELANMQEGQRSDIKSFDISCENLEFSYKDGKKVIDGISFNSYQDKVSALVGPSGCGKTTVLRLLSRLYDYDKGKISIDGKEISTVDTKDLFGHISMVFQDVILFNGSVMDNIRLGDLSASDDEVLKAARLANCDEFVNKLPMGYKTLIGENGSNLSGGERQRISIARAFLKNAEIILLDEIAASLDVENEKYIQESLNELTKNKTVVLISHRMKSIQNVDQIIVMNEGKIEALGTHEFLLDNSKTYAKMIESSRLSEEFVY